MIEETIKNRTQEYGSFMPLANLSQALTTAALAHYENTHVNNQQERQRPPPFVAEALQMINHKIARLMNGNAFDKDGWLDIAGYAKLVVDILDEAQALPTTTSNEE